jgi:acyl-CoA synthetase (AMP-forming)/AMP-acid ligase II
MGAIAVFVDPWISAKRMAAFASFAEPSAFIGIGKSHWLRFMEPSLRRIDLTVTNGRNLAGFPARYQLRKLQQGNPDWKLATVHENDSALITFTSGSSGEPKGANRTHGFLAAQHRALNHEFPCLSSDIDMPMFPIFALNNLVSGITSVVPNMDFRKVAEVDGKLLTRQMRKHSVTTCTASPPFLDRICDVFESEGGAEGGVPQLRRVLTGGAAVSNRQLQRWQSCMPGCEIVVAYGSTEAEPVSHIDADVRLKLDRSRPGYCVGMVSKLIEARVIRICKTVSSREGESVDSLTLPNGEIGELVVSGKHVCRDYYKNPSATAENKLLDQDGRVWHRMGDTGWFDENNRFWLAGRVHSTIERDGVWIHPQLVEQQISEQFEGVLKVAAVGVPDSRLGEACWVVIQVPRLDSGLVGQVQEMLTDSETPCDNVVLVTNPLPVDPRHNSKIDYDLLRKELVNKMPLAKT